MKLSQIAAAAVAFLAGSASEAAQVWTAPAAVKVRPQAQPSQTSSATAVIAAAKNEFESFHVVVTGPATGVSMSLEGLGDGKGHSISGRNLTLYREALINVPVQTGGDGAAGAVQTWAASEALPARKATAAAASWESFIGASPWLAASRNDECSVFRSANEEDVPPLPSLDCGSRGSSKCLSGKRGQTPPFTPRARTRGAARATCGGSPSRAG